MNRWQNWKTWERRGENRLSVTIKLFMPWLSSPLIISMFPHLDYHESVILSKTSMKGLILMIKSTYQGLYVVLEERVDQASVWGNTVWFFFKKRWLSDNAGGVRVHTCICTHAYAHTHTHTHTHTHGYAHMHVHTHMHTCMCAHTCICTHACAHMHVHQHAYARMHVCICMWVHQLYLCLLA